MNQIDKLMALADAAAEARRIYGSHLYNEKTNDARQALRDALEAALNPKDWRLVPVNATNDMCSRANSMVDLEPALTYDEFRSIWKAMLSAAPTPPEAA